MSSKGYKTFADAKVQQKNDIRKFVYHFLIFSLMVYNNFRNSSANGGRFLLSPYIIFSPFPSDSISAWNYWVYQEIT